MCYGFQSRVFGDEPRNVWKQNIKHALLFKQQLLIRQNKYSDADGFEREIVKFNAWKQINQKDIHSQLNLILYFFSVQFQLKTKHNR